MQNQKQKRTYKIIPHIYIHGRDPKHQWGWTIHTTGEPKMHQVKGSEISSEHVKKKTTNIYMLTKQYVSDFLYDREKFLENKI